MKSVTQAFFDGEICFYEMLYHLTRAELAKEIIARGGNRMPDGAHLAHSTGVIRQGTADENGNAVNEREGES
jgi:hypothetical protein